MFLIHNRGMHFLQGEKGPVGEAGFQGEKGKRGDLGMDGRAGVKGEQVRDCFRLILSR